MSDVPAAYSSVSGAGSTDPKLDRDKFLVHQKMLSINAKYYVYDENVQPLFFVERPALKLRAHIEIYDDDTKAAKRLTLRQDKILWINQQFTLLTPEEQTICTYERQGLLSMLRRTCTYAALMVRRSPWHGRTRGARPSSASPRSSTSTSCSLTGRGPGPSTAS